MSGIMQLILGGSRMPAWVNTSGSLQAATGKELFSVAYGNGIYVAAGVQGRSAYSSDGVNWSSGNLSTVWGTSDYILSLCFRASNNTFYAVGDNGKCAYSTDGNSWTMIAAFTTAFGSTYSAKGIATDGTLLVVVGANGRCVTSTNGTSWTLRSSLATVTSSNTMYAVCYNGTKYYAAGASGKLASSTDGTTWTNSTAFTTAFGSANTVYTIAATGNNIVALGTGGRCAISSDGGASWSNATTQFTTYFGANTPYCIAWVGNRFIAGGAPGSSSSIAKYDLTNWSSESDLQTLWDGIGTVANVDALCSNGSTIVVLGWDNANTLARSVIYQ